MNVVVIGQYIKGNSILHRMDPRTKVIGMVLLIVALFLIPLKTSLYSFYGMLGFTVFTISLVLLSKVPIGKVIKGLRPIIFLLTFTAVVQLFYESDGSAIFNIPKDIRLNVSLVGMLIIVALIVLYNVTKKLIRFRNIYLMLIVALCFFFLSYDKVNIVSMENFHPYIHITDLVVMRIVFLILRVINVVIISSLLTFTTSTTDLNNAFEKLMSPLKYIRVPVSVISFMLSLTLRYIPTVLEEAEKTMKAQASRGSDFNEGSIKQKIVQIVSLLVPMFVISLERAEELASAMEVRGYVLGAKRTAIDVYKLHTRDYLSLTLSTLILGAFIVLNILL